MSIRNSLVYEENVVQRYLKDILIPVLGFRDVSKRFGQYTELVEALRDDVTDLQIPDKSKYYIHEQLKDPIYIEYPTYRYGTNDTPADEKVYITLGAKQAAGAGNKSYDFTICIPNQMIEEVTDEMQAYCVECNINAYNDIKTVKIESVQRSTAYGMKRAYKVSFPEITSDSHPLATLVGYVVVASENRNVKVVDTWYNLPEDTEILTYNTSVVQLGSVPYFDPIEDPDELVRSKTARELVCLTQAEYDFLLGTGQTSDTQLYFLREDPDGLVNADLSFSSVEEFKERESLIYKIFGDDWSGVTIKFADTVTNIDGLLKGSTITKTPKSIQGDNIVSAKELFRDATLLTTITDMTFLSTMKKLETIMGMFRGCEKLTTNPTEELIKENTRVRNISFAFRDTAITAAYPYWDEERSYVPDPGEYDTNLTPDPDPVVIYLYGSSCYRDCNSIPAADYENIPEFWKYGSGLLIESDENMKQWIDYLISDNEGDLSNLYIHFNYDAPTLAGLFKGKDITATLNTITTSGAITSIAEMYANCPNLTKIVEEQFTQIGRNVLYANNVYSNNPKLETVPIRLFVSLRNCISYDECFANCPKYSNHTPLNYNGLELWELEGSNKYPAVITGTDCFSGTKVENLRYVPVEWGGEGETPPVMHSITFDENPPIITVIDEETQEETQVEVVVLGSQYGIREPAGATVQIPECELTAEGFVFKEWNTESDGTGDIWDVGADYVLDADLALFAIWEEDV